MDREADVTRASPASIRYIHDRAVRAQRSYATRLREAVDALQPWVEEGDPAAVALVRSIEAELNHIAYGSAIVDPL